MIYKAEKIFLEDKILHKGYLKIEGDRFGEATETGAEVCEDFGDHWIIPGLLDTHIHGYAGVDFMRASSREISRGAKALARDGVTGFLPTTMTASRETLREGMRSLGAHRSLEGEARLLGIHGEGPFLAEAYGGAQDRRFLLPPGLSFIRELRQISEGKLSKITMAPELPGALEVIEALTREGVQVSLGHTGATYRECLEAIQAGAGMFTHVFNGMRPFHHREPGAVGAALLTEGVFCEVIADGIHLGEETLKLLMKVRGLEGIVLVSDALSVAGRAEESPLSGKESFQLREGRAVMEDGRLAGGTMSLLDQIKLLRDKGIADLWEGLRMASLQPARSMGLEDRFGSIRRGKVADFLVVDASLRIHRVFMNGRSVL